MESSQKHKENHQIPTDILDDLASRFIINVPVEERTDFIRICFQIELAHWFYLDFYCSVEEDKLIPCGIKQFAFHLFHHIPFLKEHLPHLNGIMNEFKMYKMSVPTYGAILMTPDLAKVLLVQSFWAKSSWGFPKGKVNEDEQPLHCAVREVYEETGYDISKLIQPNDYIEGVLNYQYTRLYIVQNVPAATVFVPRTRKEIKSCEWYNLDYLPTHKMDTVCKSNLGINANSFFMIMPFVKRLKRWLHDNKTNGGSATTASGLTMMMNVAQQPSAYPQPQQQKQKKSNAATSTGGLIGAAAATSSTTTGKKRQRHKSMGDLDGIKPSAGLQLATIVAKPMPPMETAAAAATTTAVITTTATVIGAPVTMKRNNKAKHSATKRQLFGGNSDATMATKSLSNVTNTIVTAIQKRSGKETTSTGAIAQMYDWQVRLNNNPAIMKWKNFRFTNKTKLCQCLF